MFSANPKISITDNNDCSQVW